MDCMNVPVYQSNPTPPTIDLLQEEHSKNVCSEICCLCDIGFGLGAHKRRVAFQLNLKLLRNICLFFVCNQQLDFNLRSERRLQLDERILFDSRNRFFSFVARPQNVLCPRSQSSYLAGGCPYKVNECSNEERNPGSTQTYLVALLKICCYCDS
ncbi:hypothetical protein AVEN_130606-1 [Araneus ventricosus]|uniref:Uncharacterized protein n=1 Tax=Araneus ventricosus TaxID=182803 RepID=A0A4Y2W5A4_ARAVE|nr:hypothetical protein AVEN_130606-1 [Araneus ventricosus]